MHIETLCHKWSKLFIDGDHFISLARKVTNLTVRTEHFKTPKNNDHSVRFRLHANNPRGFTANVMYAFFCPVLNCMCNISQYVRINCGKTKRIRSTMSDLWLPWLLH
jgi:hypothetical protein